MEIYVQGVLQHNRGGFEMSHALFFMGYLMLHIGLFLWGTGMILDYLKS